MAVTHTGPDQHLGSITDSLAERLGHRLAPDQIITDLTRLRTYECDAITGYRVVPSLVALPESTDEVAAVVAAYDFTRFATVADVGGGRGHLLRAVLDAAPGTSGVLFDLPEVVDILGAGHPRMTATAGDFFVDALPAADAYVLMEVLHDWSDEECVAILGAIRRAASDDATLLVVESVLPEQLLDPRSRTLDVVMLAVTGGRERTANELSALFERAGFALDTIIDTASPMRIVTAHAA